MKAMRTNPAPCFSAKRVPIRLPTILASAMASAKCHQTWPWIANKTSAEKLVAVLISLAEADAFKKS